MSSGVKIPEMDGPDIVKDSIFTNINVARAVLLVITLVIIIFGLIPFKIFCDDEDGKDEESHKEGDDKEEEDKDSEHKDGEHKDGEHKDGEHKEGEDKKEGFSLLPRMDMRFSEMDPLEAENTVRPKPSSMYPSPDPKTRGQNKNFVNQVLGSVKNLFKQM